MRDTEWKLMTAWALLGSGLVLVACGADPATPDGGVDAGTGPLSCSVQAPTACPDPAPHYADVSPIFERRCAVCHGATPGGPWPLDDYKSIADWEDTIRADLLDCSMPPTDAGVPMTLDERTAILTWIRCGLPQ